MICIEQNRTNSTFDFCYWKKKFTIDSDIILRSKISFKKVCLHYDMIEENLSK